MVSATRVSERRTQQKGCAFWDTTTVTRITHEILYIETKIFFDALIRNACEFADAEWNE